MKFFTSTCPIGKENFFSYAKYAQRSKAKKRQNFPWRNSLVKGIFLSFWLAKKKMQFFALKSKLFLFFNGIKTKPPRLKDIFCRLFFLRLFRRILQITKMCKNAIFSIFKAFFHFTAKQEEINRVFFAFFICSVQLQRTLKKFIMKKNKGCTLLFSSVKNCMKCFFFISMESKERWKNGIFVLFMGLKKSRFQCKAKSYCSVQWKQPYVKNVIFSLFFTFLAIFAFFLLFAANERQIETKCAIFALLFFILHEYTV